MLKSLTIKNVALIRETDIEFSNGLDVLSGETGAGKSVVLEALNFALGQKADKSMICHGENGCSVTCVFDVSENNAVREILSEMDVDFDDEIIVKRTLNIDGKSSIKLNGESVSASMLRKVTSLLVDVHGQSDHFLLLKEANQLSLIDGLCGEKLEKVKTNAVELIKRIHAIDGQLEMLGGDDVNRARKIDYLQFAINEITSADLRDGEEETLLERKKRLLNLEKISSACGEAYSQLALEGGVTDVLSTVARKIAFISQFGKEYEELSNRLETSLEEITDIAEIINDSVDDSFDEGELEEIENRLNRINSIKKKYGKTYADVMASLDAFNEELNLICDSEVKTKQLNDERAEIIKQLDVCYDEMTTLRKEISAKLSVDLSLKLKELAMKGANFGVEFTQTQGEVLSSKGRDNVCFMFTANKGEVLKPLSKIISGGELSRLMLAIKAVTGGDFGASTYVFDEIDVGISGEAAQVVAENFARIAIDKQIVAISHLPQIIAMADVGFLINKREEGDRTVTRVNKLDEIGKADEVLRLIGGNRRSEAALVHANEMIDCADKFKQSIK